jgi:hypothetical protein
LVSAARARGLPIGLFYDLEIQQVGEIGPVLSDTPYIRPSVSLAGSLADAVAGFYRSLPRDLWLVDRAGRLPIMIYGVGFDRTIEDRGAWDTFYRTLLTRLEEALGLQPVVYWSARGYVQLEYAFQRFPDQIRPYNFVLDSPQHQLAPGAVTWNVNFDNLGVWRAYRLQRAIRDDPRYLQEMLWLAKHTAPELLFVYGWNEFFEGANVMPDTTYGARRYELVKAMLAEVRGAASHRLPCTLLVVDELADAWRLDGRRVRMEGQFALYPMRRLVPQADVALASEVTPALLRRYDLIVSLAQRARGALRRLAGAIDRKRIVFVGPAAAAVEPLRARFASRAEPVNRSRKVELIDAAGRRLGRTLVYDDVLAVTPAPNVETLGWIGDRGRRTPVLLRRGDDFWVNAFVPDDRLLAPVFERVYGRRLERGILFGKGARSQRIEVSPAGVVTRYRFSAPAVFEHEPLPAPWSTPPPAGLP